MRFGFRKVDRTILDRFSHDLCFVFLNGERGAWDLVDPTVFLLLCRLEAILNAAHLPRLDFTLSNHLRSTGVSVGELLASPGVEPITTYWLIIAHSREPLLGNLSHIVATLIGKAYFVGLGGLDELGLVHDLSDLFLKEAVRMYSNSMSTAARGVVVSGADR